MTAAGTAGGRDGRRTGAVGTLPGGAPLLPGGAPPRRLPGPTRQRRTGLIVSLLLVVAGCAAAGALLVGSAGRTTEVLVAARSVPAGHPIGAEDLGTARISAAGVRAIAAGDAGTVVGQTAAVPLVHGQLLNRDMLTRQTVPAAGEAMVGLALRPGQLPGAGLEPGDRVSVLAVSGPDTAEPVAVAPRVLAAQATVYAVGSDAATGGDILVTVVVPDAQAGPLAAHSSAGRLAVVKVAAP